MPFPTISTVLDNFNRANSSTLGPNWSEPLISTDTTSGWITDLSAAAPTFNGVFNSVYYNVSTYGPDIEVYAGFNVMGFRASLAARMVEGGTSTTDGYMLRFLNTAGVGGASDEMSILRVDNGVLTQLGETASIPQIPAGASFGFEIIGTTLTGYYNLAGGSWSTALSRTDATYSAAGNFGLRSNNDQTIHIDNFSGGTIIGGGDPALGFAKRRTDWAGFRM